MILSDGLDTKCQTLLLSNWCNSSSIELVQSTSHMASFTFFGSIDDKKVEQSIKLLILDLVWIPKSKWKIKLSKGWDDLCFYLKPTTICCEDFGSLKFHASLSVSSCFGWSYSSSLDIWGELGLVPVPFIRHHACSPLGFRGVKRIWKIATESNHTESTFIIFSIKLQILFKSITNPNNWDALFSL